MAIAGIDEKDLIEKYYNRSKEFNIFKVLKLEDYEIRHSNFLAWLFNPKETHKIGSLFFKKFLKTIKDDKNFDKNINVVRICKENINVYREFRTDCGRFSDILIEGETFVCLIENKYGAKECLNQTLDYKNFILNKYQGKHHIFVYLDINEELNAKHENGYILCTYKNNILPVLKSISSGRKIKQLDILNQYITVLEENYNMFNFEPLPNLAKNIQNFKLSIIDILADSNKFYEQFDNRVNSIEFFPKDCYKTNNKIPRSKEDEKSCMLYYQIVLEKFSGVEFRVVLRQSNNKKYKLLKKRLNAGDEKICYPIKETLIDYTEFLRLVCMAEPDERECCLNKIMNNFIEQFENENNNIRNILLA
ncbi:MAG: PD-(D/E)XK nuclease family protein [Candidatus Gastranaerophilales bacterium]|nr:PD-(D/E)XK nuclease family protein [Candidatus Gastranaerophilales bacterium]